MVRLWIRPHTYLHSAYHHFCAHIRRFLADHRAALPGRFFFERFGIMYILWGDFHISYLSFVFIFSSIPFFISCSVRTSNTKVDGSVISRSGIRSLFDCGARFGFEGKVWISGEKRWERGSVDRGAGAIAVACLEYSWRFFWQSMWIREERWSAPLDGLFLVCNRITRK
jgi:hypothetical protein